ncbi:hypothetical protein GCM10023213_09160 [Prosthecobacter algae]|uniref:Prepilin-type N-terminal cleavage/methylation domain-containing protein n=1 Tax=Prosthecobacter algae TaxID=1144682 RepID=A0ABP9NWK9_9BACT
MRGTLKKKTPLSSGSAARVAAPRGFSLVELLVTISVAFIVITALMQSMVATLDSWTKQDKQFSSQREGRAALRLLTDDLASIAVIPAGGPLADDPQAVAGKQPMRFLLQSGTPTSTSTSRMAFLRTVKRASKGTDSGRGDLQLVLYGIALTPDGGASGVEEDASSQKLVRREFSPAETYRRLEGHRIGGQPMVFEEDWKELESLPKPTTGEETPAAAPPSARNAVLAHDVIRFECKALESLMPGQPVPQPWPTEQLPKWVEVTLRVTNRQTGRLLKSAQDWRGEGVRAAAITNGTPEVYEDDAEVRTFSMRLRLPPVAL